jgi:hypothetical protein
MIGKHRSSNELLLPFWCYFTDIRRNGSGRESNAGKIQTGYVSNTNVTEYHYTRLLVLSVLPTSKEDCCNTYITVA